MKLLSIFISIFKLWENFSNILFHQYNVFVSINVSLIVICFFMAMLKSIYVVLLLKKFWRFHPHLICFCFSSNKLFSFTIF